MPQRQGIILPSERKFHFIPGLPRAGVAQPSGEKQRDTMPEPAQATAAETAS
jgi:hypothetical protein